MPRKTLIDRYTIYNRRIHVPKGAVAIGVAYQKIFHPLDHFDYSFIDKECCCDLCTIWRDTHTKLNSFGINGPRYIPGSAMESGVTRRGNEREYNPISRDYISARSAFLAANAKRELYCELSWHSSQEDDKSSALEFMKWLKSIILDRQSRTDGWWEVRAITLPIGFWQTLFRLKSRGETADSLERALSQEFNISMPVNAVQAMISASGMAS